MATEKPGPRFEYRVRVLGQVETILVEDPKTPQSIRPELHQPEGLQKKIAYAIAMTLSIGGIVGTGIFGSKAMSEFLDVAYKNASMGVLGSGVYDTALSVAIFSITGEARNRIARRLNESSQSKRQERPEDPRVR